MIFLLLAIFGSGVIPVLFRACDTWRVNLFLGDPDQLPDLRRRRLWFFRKFIHSWQPRAPAVDRPGSDTGNPFGSEFFLARSHSAAGRRCRGCVGKPALGSNSVGVGVRALRRLVDAGEDSRFVGCAGGAVSLHGAGQEWLRGSQEAISASTDNGFRDIRLLLHHPQISAIPLS